MCRDGAGSVQEKVISRTGSDRLLVLVVWTPRYPGDSRAKAIAATKIVPDPRAVHFWDAGGTVSRLFGGVIGLPEGNRFAWDTYMIFGPRSEWKDVPPAPSDWMHQLGALGQDHPRWLDDDRFRETVQAMIEEQ